MFLPVPAYAPAAHPAPLPPYPRAVLINIDGVLTVSWQPLAGAVAALARLRAAALPLALVTNTTSRTRASIAAALTGAGSVVAAVYTRLGTLPVRVNTNRIAL